MNFFSAINRPELLKQLKATNFDLLVIGGGITGCGIALDAASRGLKVALIDMQDLAAGTSSRSTRLIHGGLRYLKQFELKLVSEVASEREIIYKNAPHLVRPEPILLPITKNGSFGKTLTRVAMWIYEFLAGVKKEERHRYLNADQTWKLEPTLKREDLLGGILYYEYHTNDARLTLAVLKEAVNRGALAVTYLKAVSFNYEKGKISGVKAEDQINKGSYDIKANFVINAAGPWVDDLDSLDNKTHGNKLQPTKGIHIVIPHSKLPLKQSVYFDTSDNRMVFAIPHRDKTYIGTTDTFYNDNKVDPPVMDADKNYLLKCVNDYFSTASLSLSDIESCWAGIRPLIRKPGKNPSEISRKDEIFEWESGLISIAGGKLSGYRKMAERVVDLVAKKIIETDKKVISACSTRHIVLSGGPTSPDKFAEFSKNKLSAGSALGLNTEEIELLVHRYGSETDKLLEVVRTLKAKERTYKDFPILLHAELVYAINEEMCLTPADFFIRRTGMMYFEKKRVQKYKTVVIDIMQEILKWENPQRTSHEKDLDRLIELTS